MVYTLGLMKDWKHINQYDEFAADFIIALKKANLPIDKYTSIWHKLSKWLSLKEEESALINDLFLWVGEQYTVFRNCLIGETWIDWDWLQVVFNGLAMGILDVNVSDEDVDEDI